MNGHREAHTGGGTDVTDRGRTRGSRDNFARDVAFRPFGSRRARCLESGFRNLAIVSAIARTTYHRIRSEAERRGPGVESPPREGERGKMRDRFSKLVFTCVDCK